MNKNALWMFAAILCFCGMTMQSCFTKGKALVATHIPQSPDYSDTTMWIMEDGDAEGTGADVPEK